MTNPAWGASPETWTHFARTLGLEADLLPVVSNPKAVISENSKMRDLGKTPSRYDADGGVVGIPKWTQHSATDKDIARWIKHSDYGICIQTRNVRAIDIDIADPAASAKVRELVELGCGALPQRFRQGTGKCLLAFRMPGDFAKRIIRTEHGLIEFLATGQQFIAVGTHPSGTRYEWMDGDGVIGLPAEIPELTPAEFETLWQALVEQFALPDGESRVRNGIVPSVPRTADDMTDPVVAWLDENGWVTDYNRDGRVDVRCPWEGEHTSDSGPSSTSWFPAGVGGFAQGHFRCLHAHCVHRTDGDFVEAIGYQVGGFDVLPAVADAKGQEVQPLPPFKRSPNGAPLATLNNVLMAVRRPDVCGFSVGYDEFKDTIMVALDGDSAWRPITDADYTTMRSTLEKKGFLPIGRELIRDVVLSISTEFSFDSAKQWAAGLQWDGVERIETFYSDYFGVEDTPYTRAVALYTWTGMAARCVSPGHKVDMVPVFIGDQGVGKTTAVEALAPIEETFVEINLERKDDDLARGLRGKLVGEIAELRGLQTRDAEAIKAWVTRRWEEWTPKYREFATRFARRLMLFGTGNEQGFLDDAQERRWLPMLVGQIDVPGIRAARDQLWAEAIVRFTCEGVLWQDAQRLAGAEHAAFKASDPWDQLIADWLSRDSMDGQGGEKRGDGVVRIVDVLVGACGLRATHLDRRSELRAGKCLRKLGYGKHVALVNGVNAKVWRKREWL